MVEFSYGGANEDGLVAPGDTFTAAGGHIAICDDTTKHRDRLQRADLIYTDPPWDQRILGAFKRGANAPDAPDFQPLMEWFVDSLIADQTVFIEMGQKGTPQLMAMLETKFRHVAAERVTYDRKQREHRLIMATDFALPSSHLRGEDSIDLPRLALKEFPHTRVHDPFLGLGTTLRAADYHAISGVELNPNKLARCIKTHRKLEWVKQA